MHLCLSRISAIAAIFTGFLCAQPGKAPAVPPADASKTAPAAATAAVKQADARRLMEESLARQKAAIANQAGPPPPGGFFTVGWSGPATIPVPVIADCDPIPESESEPLITAAATRQSLDAALLRAMIQQESAFRACAVSEKGAQGLMQLMPATAEQFHVSDAFDPKQNIEAGAQYIKQLMGRFKGDLKLALAAYNAGPEKVDGPTPAVPDIPESQNYVDAILKALADSKSKTPAKK